jgi:hypothetical protein
MERHSLCPACTACPELVIDGDQVRVGEDTNTAALRKEEWNILIDRFSRDNCRRSNFHCL